MRLRELIAKDFAFYSMSFVFMQIVNILLAIFIRNTLGPEQMGIWILVQVVLGYTKYIDLGLTGAASIEIPIEKGRNHFEKAERIRGVSLSFALLSSSALSFLLVAASFVAWTGGKELLAVSLLTLAALSFLQRLSMFCI